jgi:hypothetical protein
MSPTIVERGFFINDIKQRKCANENDNKQIVKQKEKLKVLDLFCGCGGMSKGLSDAGLDIIAGIDIWDKAIDNYKKNYHHRAICADLTKLSPDIFCNTYNVNKNTITIIQELLLLLHDDLRIELFLY